MRWLFLIHHLPSRPLYLRAKIRQRLLSVGSIAVKNAVYVLPYSEEAVEDFSWIAQEVIAAGADVFVAAAELMAGLTDEELTARFNEDRASAYEKLLEDCRRAQRAKEALPPFRERYEKIRRIDFFDAQGKKEVEKMLRVLETPKPSSSRSSKAAKKPKAAIWVTRRGVKVDRMASAWLIRKFIDPVGSFRMVDADRW